MQLLQEKAKKDLITLYPKLFYLGGIILLLSFIGIANLTRLDVFTWGKGHESRPLVKFLIAYFIAWAGFFMAFIAVGKLKAKQGFYFVLVLAVLLRILMLSGNPIQADDFYRYIWDGQVLSNGMNPTAHAPSDLKVESLNVSDEDLEDAETVKFRVNHPHVVTIYPHVAQSVFWLNAQLWGWDHYGLRKTYLLFDIALIVVLCLILRRLQKPLASVLIYAWNPLVFKEVFNNMHIDIIAAFFIALFILAFLHNRLFLAHLAIIAAAFVKIIPIAILPFLFYWQWQKSERKAAIFNLLFSINLTILLSMTAYIASPAPFSGLKMFVKEWQHNDFIFAIINYLFEFMNMKNAFRWTKIFLFIAFCIWVLFILKNKLKTKTSVLYYSAYGLFFIFIISPVMNPWYLLWILPFMVIIKHPPWLFMMVCTSFYYLYFWLEYNYEESLAQKYMNRVNVWEYGIFIIMLAAYLIYRKFKQTNEESLEKGDCQVV